jgi:hypothetical protein
MCCGFSLKRSTRVGREALVLLRTQRSAGNALDGVQEA